MYRIMIERFLLLREKEREKGEGGPFYSRVDSFVIKTLIKKV